MLSLPIDQHDMEAGTNCSQWQYGWPSSYCGLPSEDLSSETAAQAAYACNGSSHQHAAATTEALCLVKICEFLFTFPRNSRFCFQQEIMETKTQSRVMERKGGKHLPWFCFIECSKQPMCMHVKHHLDPGTQAQESNSYSFPGNCAIPVLSQASSFPGNSDCTGSSREDQVIHFASV